jgi:hypothetical protein
MRDLQLDLLFDLGGHFLCGGFEIVDGFMAKVEAKRFRRRFLISPDGD